MDWQDYTPDGEAAHAVPGTLKLLPQLHSPELDNARDILVYLPPSYGEADRRWPVIYMHDGQNLFDDATAFAGAWHVEEAIARTSRSGLEAIVVGIPNLGEGRLEEYSPFVDPENGGGRGDAYLEFIVRTLKPIVDADFDTIPDRYATGIAGSSMGGLISLYGFFRHPDVFGYVGAMSPALWFAERAIFGYLERAPKVPGRIYLDVGTGEGTDTVNDVRRMRRLLTTKGYRQGRELLCVVEPGAHHMESAWRRRLPREISFFLSRIARAGAGAGGEAAAG
jgi:predicted alpha/beta superfamily hydrolase